MFDKAVKTETAAHAGKEDKKAPDWKKLNPQIIALPTGLQGIPSCTDGKLIHGDQQEMVEKLREIHVIGSDTLKVQQFQEIEIEQYANHTIKQGRELTVGIYDKTEIKGDREMWVHGKDDEHYLIHREIDEPVERIEHKNISFEWGIASAEATGLSIETKLVALALENVKAELSTCHFLNKAIEEKLSGVQSYFEVFETRVGLLLLAAQHKFNAAVNWALSSPTS
jgi:hypothetical protein